MESLFENRVTVDKGVLLEWYKKDFLRNNKVFAGVHLGMMALYVVSAVVMGVLATVYNWPSLWLFVLVFVVLTLVFLVNLLLQYRIHIWAMLRRDKGKTFPQEVGTFFYSDLVIPVDGHLGQDPAQKLANAVAGAEELTREYEDVMQKAAAVDKADTVALAELRGRLQALQDNMEALGRAAHVLNQSQRYPLAAITAYQQTANLHILYFGGQALLVAKNGFTKGNEQEFKPFMAKKLTEACEASQNEKVRARLAKDLKKHFNVYDAPSS